MGRISLNGRRTIVGIAGSVTLLCLANYYLDLRLFGEFGNKVLVASFIVLAVSIFYFGSTVREMQEYLDKKRTSMK